MSNGEPDNLITSTRNDWMRLRTFIVLRWLAIVGQTIAILTATYFLDVDLAIDLCFVAIGASVAFNLVSTVSRPSGYRLSERDATLTLLFDLVQLGLLLYLTGGLSNPFSILLLAPLIISATALSLRATAILGVVFITLISLLIWNFVPLKTHSDVLIQQSPLLIFGNWTALITGFAFLALYARRVTVENFSMSEALAATKLALGREHRLTSLGGVVAATAHELGTPLATIKLVASELVEELADNPDLAKDAELIRSQADRCRDILRDMGQSGKEDMHLLNAPISAVIEEAAAPHLDRGKKVYIRVDGVVSPDSPPNQPEIMRRPEIIHGIRNLIQNAVDFATDTVWIDVDWDDAILSIRVGDNGPGYPADLIGKIGDPYVGRRNKSRRPGYDGMGLGLFIAKTLLERTGAQLTFSNGPADANSDAVPTALAAPSGAVVFVEWDKAAIIAPPQASRRALGSNTRITN